MFDIIADTEITDTLQSAICTKVSHRCESRGIYLSYTAVVGEKAHDDVEYRTLCIGCAKIKQGKVHPFKPDPTVELR